MDLIRQLCFSINPAIIFLNIYIYMSSLIDFSGSSHMCNFEHVEFSEHLALVRNLSYELRHARRP